MKKQLLFTFFLACTISVFAQVPSYVPTNGLVGWWPFNGNANDESGNGNNGLVNGAILTTDRFDGIGNAYRFLPNNFIEIIGSANLNFTDSLSISVWYKNNQLYGGTYVSKHISGSLNSSFCLYNEGATGCGPVNYITDVMNSVNTTQSLGFCDTNQWHLLTFVFNKPTLKMYCDGILTATTNSNTIKSTSNKIYFGATSTTTSPFVSSGTNAKLDDIGIWNRALTECEVRNLYTAGG